MNLNNLYYINENTIIKLNKNYQILNEGLLDAWRAEARASSKKIAARDAGIYYTWKNGKLFFFFNTNAFGPIDFIKNIIAKLINRIIRFILLDPVTKKEVENYKNFFEIKKGADFNEAYRIIDYYGKKVKLDAIVYNKICNFWSYLVIPFVNGPKVEKKLREDLNNHVFDKTMYGEDVFKNPDVFKRIETDCNKGFDNFKEKSSKSFIKIKENKENKISIDDQIKTLNNLIKKII